MFPLRCCVLAACLAAPLAPQQRLLVPAQYATLAAAADAASDGDTIELAPGVQSTGNATIVESLHIVGIGTTLNGNLTLSIPAGRWLTMSGCRLGETRPPLVSVIGRVHLHLDRCAGRVTIGDALPGFGTITISDSSQVLLHDIGLNDNVTYSSEPALTIRRSTVVLDRCHFTGHRSLENVYRGTLAALLTDADVRCRNSTFVGGNGQVWFFSTNPGRNAIHATSSILRLEQGVAVATGYLGTDPPLTLDGGLAVLDPSVTAGHVALNGAVVHRAAMPIVVGQGVVGGGNGRLDLHSPVGTIGALLVGFPADRWTVPGVAGDAWLDPATMGVVALGIQNGSLSWTSAIPAAWPRPTEFRWHGLVLDGGVVTLTSPGAAVLR